MIASAEATPFTIVPLTNAASSIPMHGGKDLKPGIVRGLIADMGLTVEEFSGRL